MNVFQLVLKQMRSELEGEDPTPLERRLVERVVATGLQVQCYETLYAQNQWGLLLIFQAMDAAGKD